MPTSVSPTLIPAACMFLRMCSGERPYFFPAWCTNDLAIHSVGVGALKDRPEAFVSLHSSSE